MKQQNSKICMEHPNRTGLYYSKKRHYMVRFSLLSALFLFAWVALVLAEEPTNKNMQSFYQQNCVHCHGADGSAIGPDGQKLKGQDLTDESWQQRTNDDEMVKTILKGKFFGLAMPKFKNSLTREEAQRMVTEVIRNAKKGVVIEPETPEPDVK